jgi:hypothetical protein
MSAGSTTGKLVTQLESERKVRRAPGGREGKRRLPDLWSIASKQPAAKDAKTKRASTTTGNIPGDAGRLKPGQLEPLVLAYLTENTDSAPHGPTAIAKALQRSSGAVSNCLVRLVRDKSVQEVSDKPRRSASRLDAVVAASDRGGRWLPPGGRNFNRRPASVAAAVLYPREPKPFSEPIERRGSVSIWRR